MTEIALHANDINTEMLQRYDGRKQMLASQAKTRMEQTSLNLIAIGIFIMTLAVLVGPLVHLSPIIPAAITFCLLGLATIDTLGLQGKGATLLLDAAANFSPEHRDRVIHHEAGHFLAAYLLGIPISGYTLTAWEALQQGTPGFGGVRFDTNTLFDNAIKTGELRLILDRFSTVWMAGIAAEQLIYNSVEGGRDDRQKIADALVFFERPASEAKQKQQWGQLQAKTMLEKHQSAYHALVEALKARESVASCYQILHEQIATQSLDRH